MVRSPQHHRPFGVTLTAWGVFILGVANGWQAVGLARQSRLLLELGVTLNPWVRFSGALVWFIVFAAASFAVWRRRPIVRYAIPILVLIYAVYQLGLLGLFAASAESRSGWPADAVQYLLAIVMASWALNRPAARDYFERQLPDS